MSNKGKVRQEQPKPEAEVSVGKVAEGSTAVAAVGLRQRRAFMLKNFIPGVDWINKNVVGGGKGTKIMVGRIVGHVHATEDKHGILPNGDPSLTIIMEGEFETESYLDGEVSNCSSVYLNGPFPAIVKGMFEADKLLKTVEVDLDVGIEATGKTIPYAWVIINYREGIDMTPLRKLRLSRPRPEGAPKLAAPEPQKALAAQ